MRAYIIPGNYACATNTDAATLKNCPLSTAFDLKVYRSAGGKTDGYIIQEYTAHDAKQRVLVPYNPYTSGTKWGDPTFLATKDDLSSFLDVVTAEYTVTLSANQSTITSGSVTIKNGYTPLPKMLSVRTTGSDAVFASGDNYYENGKIYVYIKNTVAAELTIKVRASMLCYKS